MSESRNTTETSEAVLSLEGATCAACVYTIERIGRKLPGIDDLSVDASEGRIDVIYDGKRDSLEEIVKIVDRLGYSAEIRE